LRSSRAPVWPRGASLLTIQSREILLGDGLACMGRCSNTRSGRGGVLPPSPLGSRRGSRNPLSNPSSPSHGRKIRGGGRVVRFRDPLPPIPLFPILAWGWGSGVFAGLRGPTLPQDGIKFSRCSAAHTWRDGIFSLRLVANPCRIPTWRNGSSSASHERSHKSVTLRVS